MVRVADSSASLGRWRRYAAASPDNTSAGMPANLAAVAPQELLSGDETVLILAKPSLLFILITGFRFVLTVLLLGILAVRTVSPAYMSAQNIALITVILCLGRLIWGLLVWTSHTYMLTNRRIVTQKGVFNVAVTAVNLRKVQRATLYKPWWLAIFGLGNIGIATAATETYDATWLMIARPAATHDQIVAAINRVQ